MNYYMPTRLLSGSGCLYENRAVLSALGKRACIVTGRTSGKVSGALKDCILSLEKEGISFCVYDKVGNNPTVENCYEGGIFAKEFGADFIIGIGGGSPLDAAKAISVYAANDIAPMDIFSLSFENLPLPIAAVPTTAGTGSEATPYSILTVNSEKNKRNLSHPSLFPRIAFLDEAYTKALPHRVALDTMIDTMCHSIESILNKKSNSLSSGHALASLSLIGECKDMVHSNEWDAPVRQKLLLASCLGGMAIAQTGTSIVHTMGYPFTYFKGIPHGRANGILIAEFVRTIEKSHPEKVESIYKAMGFAAFEDFADFTKKCISPIEASFTDEELASYVKVALKAKNIPFALCEVTEGLEFSIYKNSLGM